MGTHNSSEKTSQIRRVTKIEIEVAALISRKSRILKYRVQNIRTEFRKIAGMSGNMYCYGITILMVMSQNITVSSLGRRNRTSMMHL
jgi:hypothetical protein